MCHLENCESVCHLALKDVKCFDLKEEKQINKTPKLNNNKTPQTLKQIEPKQTEQQTRVHRTAEGELMIIN